MDAPPALPGPGRQPDAAEQPAPLAEDVRDLLAHTLSGLIVQLEAIGACWESEPATAAALLASAQAAARDGLNALRRAARERGAAPA